MNIATIMKSFLTTNVTCNWKLQKSLLRNDFSCGTDSCKFIIAGKLTALWSNSFEYTYFENIVTFHELSICSIKNIEIFILRKLDINKTT